MGKPLLYKHNYLESDVDVWMSAMSLMRLLEKYNYLEFDVDVDVSHVSDETFREV